MNVGPLRGARTRANRILVGSAAVAVLLGACARKVTGQKETTTLAQPSPVSKPLLAPWWSSPEAGCRRQEIQVAGGGYVRADHPVDVAFDPAIPDFSPDSIRVVEVDAAGAVVDADVAFQFDRGTRNRLIFMASGRTGADQTRHFYVYFDTAAKGIVAKRVPARVEVDPGQDDEGQAAFKVTTQAGIYWYQKQGSSLSSLHDRDGLDWLSYHPVPGDDASGGRGSFRGMPNFHYPNGNFHPGFTVSDTQLVSSGPLKVVLRSTSSAGGDWAYETTFYPGYAVAAVTKAASKYWFLYEGTPGGEDKDGYVKAFKVVRADGTEFGHRDEWEQLMRGESWAYFRVPGLGTTYGRSFFMVQNVPDLHTDSYYLAADRGTPVGPDDLGSMTVFGFGRVGAKASLTDSQSPNRFTFGLMEPSDATGAAAHIRGTYRDLPVQVGVVETCPPAS